MVENDHLQPALTPNTLNNVQLLGAKWNQLNLMRKGAGGEKGKYMEHPNISSNAANGKVLN